MKRFSAIFKIIFSVVLFVQLFLMVSPVAMAQDAPAVLPSEGICTLDFNQCGNSSICTCPDGYEYSPVAGYCLIDDVSFATSPGVDARSVKSSCSIQAAALYIPCTRDINPVGYPSQCACPDGTEYDERLGQCLARLGY